MEIYRDTWVGTFDLEVTLVFASGTYLDQWLVRLCRVGAHITNYTPRLAVNSHRGLPLSPSHPIAPSPRG